MTARDDLISALEDGGRLDHKADHLLDAYRTDVFNEAIASLQGLLGLNPNGLRAGQLAFSVGALMGARDFPGEVPSGGGVAVNPFTDLVYRNAYATGRMHAGADGFILDTFEAVISTSDGSYGAAEEYRCRTCGAIGAQGEGPKTLLDLMAMASRHECLPRVEGGDA
jgi:hypothetical protein